MGFSGDVVLCDSLLFKSNSVRRDFGDDTNYPTRLHACPKLIITTKTFRAKQIYASNTGGPNPK
jgi:hypothetical protein